MFRINIWNALVGEGWAHQEFSSLSAEHRETILRRPSDLKLNRRDLKWIDKRWLGIRQERAFDALEGWALKEISDRTFNTIRFEFYFYFIFLSRYWSPHWGPVQPTYSSCQTSLKRLGTTTSLLLPASHHPHTSKVDTESDAASSTLLLLRTRQRDNGLASSASSMRSCSKSYASAVSGNTIGGRSNDGMSPAYSFLSFGNRC